MKWHMSRDQFRKIYLRGNRKKNLLICSIMGLLFLGIMLCGAMKETAEQGKKDAFLYNGPAIGIDAASEEAVITVEQLEQIRKIPHVLGVSDWKETLARPLDAENVRDHSGEDPDEDGRTCEKADKVVFLEDLCVELNSRFRCEQNVSLVEGEFPSYENKGILIEAHMAAQNGMKTGDRMRFQIDETGAVCTYTVCGIYKVDSDFVITENNEEGADVYIHSPYNVIFIDRRYAFESMEEGEGSFAIRGGCQIYVDAYENIEDAAGQLRDILGSGYDFYSLSENYMKSSWSAAALMEQYADIMLLVFAAAGSMVLLILFGLFAKQFETEIGILLALGRTKGSILCRYLDIMIHLVLLALAGSLFIYLPGSGFLLSAVNDVLEKTAGGANLGGASIASYETPGLGLGFHMKISSSELFHVNNFLLLGGLVLLFTMVSLILPVYKMTTVNTKEILEQDTK